MIREIRREEREPEMCRRQRKKGRQGGRWWQWRWRRVFEQGPRNQGNPYYPANIKKGKTNTTPLIPKRIQKREKGKNVRHTDLGTSHFQQSGFLWPTDLPVYIEHNLNFPPTPTIALLFLSRSN